MASNTDRAGNLAAYSPLSSWIVLVSGFFLFGGAGVAGVAAAKALTFADDNLRKALCISLKQFRQSGSGSIRYSLQSNRPRSY